MHFASELPAAESQPTQLLRNVLGGGMESPRISDDREDANGTGDDANVTKDSFDSSSPSVRYPTARYHFHGLAATQTQTQHEGYTENEGSQKENTPTSGELKAPVGFNPQPCSPRSSTTKVPPKMPNLDITAPPLGNKGTVAMTTDALLFDKAAKAVSFQSPRITGVPGSPAKAVQQSKTTHPRSNHYYRRSPSQDSFAGPVSQDPEKQFFASTRQFDVPLSELGLVSTQETHSSEAQPADAGQSIIQAMASAYADEKRNRAAALHDSAHHGRVLVAATPSHSGSSQGGPISQESDDDQQFYDRQLDPTYDEIPDNHDTSQQSTQLFDDLSQPSSSYERLLAGEPSDVPTQAVELQATQIDESGADLDVQMVEADTSNGPLTQLQTPAGASSVPSTGLRSIVDGNKPWRLQKYGITAPQHPRPQLTFQTPTRGEVIPETQPSDTTNDTAAPGPSRDFGHVRRNNAPAHPLSSPSHADAMDVVPDSEPPRAGQHPSTPLKLTSSATHGLPTSKRDGVAKHRPGDVALLSAVIEHTAGDHGDEDDDEEEVPLAATRALKIAPTNKGKGRVVGTSPAADADAMTKRFRQTADGFSVQPPQGRSWETGIPSSTPRQDAIDPANAPNAERSSRPKKLGGAKLPSVTSDRKTRSASASSSVPAKKRRISSDTEEDDELRLTADDSVFIPRAEKEEEEETEPANKDDMDVDVQENDPKPEPSTRKRKRGATSRAGSKKVSTASAKPTTAARSTPAFSSRSNNRLRSVISSRASSEPATRVFALWKQDSYYYSGTVHSHGVSAKYLVKFDDGTEDNVDVSKMRRCELIVDDEVILVEDDRRAKVKGVQSNNLGVTLEVDDGDELELFDVEVQDIRIAGRTILKQWQTRTLTMDMIIPVLKPKPLKSTPSPSKASMLSAASTKGGRGRALNRTGLVITLSPGNQNWEQDRDHVMLSIKNNGGTVIEDWSQIFPMEGTYSNTNNRWVACAGDVGWAAKDSIQRVFLLADDANQKPKFLIALALGIPCLSFDWLHATVDKASISAFCITLVSADSLHQGTKDWQPYLLPAGFCESLHARVSQMVDLDWGNSTEQLSDIMFNQVASKLFSHNSVLCLGADFVPLLKGKKVTLLIISPK